MTGYRYLPAAREDLYEAAAFYEASVPGLGDAFLDDVERDHIAFSSGRRNDDV